jgi:2-C-methyl-D-erythritol 4-phosphate cytidylyltransferase
MIHTIEAFENHNDVDAIVVCTNKEYIDQVMVWCKQYDLCKVKAVVAGGETRQQSVFNGLKAIKELIKNDDDVVLIHDAARPLISYKIIDDNIEGCKKFGAVDTVIKASDTIVQSADNNTITNIPNRSELYQGQTPQSFKFSIIYNAHLKAMNGEIKNVTDDAKLVIESGHPVHLVNGSAQNFKITTFDDLMLLKALLKVGKNGVL